MKREYWIPPCRGLAVDVRRGETVAVVDIEGGQVVDFFAESAGYPDEFLSPAVTVDCNESLRLRVGDVLYTNFSIGTVTAIRIVSTISTML